MKRRTARRALSISGAAVAVLMTVLTSQSAVAAAAEPQAPEAPEAVRLTMPMTGGGFDSDVAEANGFRIVTDEAGTRSVPVTAEAQALVAESSSASTFDSVVGNCGHAWLNGSKGNLDTVNFTTGYSVRLPVQGHQWRVQATGFITSGQKNYAQGAGPGVWSTRDSTVAIGPGFAIVPALSPVAMAILVDGEKCYSGGPSFTFD